MNGSFQARIVLHQLVQIPKMNIIQNNDYCLFTQIQSTELVPRLTSKATTTTTDEGGGGTTGGGGGAVVEDSIQRLLLRLVLQEMGQAAARQIL